ncbi:MAG: CapA family protein [Lachnospiraceae bacterium]|nr:CapA family protein [Lachnospiraceae bacterium]
MTRTGKKQILLIPAAAAIVAAAFLLFLWKGAFLPSDIGWEEQTLSWCGKEAVLKDRSLSVYSDGRKTWTTDWDWNVQSCCQADLDRDGSEELLLLVWKRGSYGDHMPFWVEKNDHDMSQHIFIYRCANERTTGLRAAWMSSAIPVRIREMQTDGQRVVIRDENGVISIWEWEDFGLKMLAEGAESLSFMACGDQLLHKAVLRRGLPDDDYSYMYAGIRDRIREADLASLNQETPLVADKSLLSDYPRFGSPAETAQSVEDLGIDIVSTANNHALDQGMYGVDVTLSVYEGLGIIPVGTHGSEEEAVRPESAVRIVTRNGIKVALLGFTYGTNGRSEADHPHAVELFAAEERLTEALSYARENADAVIVFAHWGTEYDEEPDEEQKRITNLLLEHQADVVIGTHPHVVQPYELLTGKNGHRMLVYYSLGNLISAQKQENCRRGGIASFELVRTGQNRVCILAPELSDIYTEQDMVVWGRPGNL